MAANCYRTIKIHFKRGEPDIGKKQNDIVADTCFQPVGKKIRLAFHYKSTSTTACTVEVKNMSVKE